MQDRAMAIRNLAIHIIVRLGEGRDDGEVDDGARDYARRQDLAIDPDFKFAHAARTAEDVDALANRIHQHIR